MAAVGVYHRCGLEARPPSGEAGPPRLVKAPTITISDILYPLPGRDAGGCLTRETGFELIRHMAAAEDKSWEYTLGRIDERTENLEQRIDERTEQLEQRIDGRFENLEQRIDERFEHVEQRLERVEFDVKGIQKTIDEKMLNKTTFFTFMSIVAGLLAAMIALK